MKAPLATLALAAALAATQAHAAVTYDFKANFMGSNYNPNPYNASFELTSSTFLTDGDFTAAESNLQCSGVFVTCTGVTLSSSYYANHETLLINYTGSGGTQGTANYYFDTSAFSSTGTAAQDQGPFYATATVTVSGSPDAPTAVSAAPEPGAWALMLGGVGAMGLILRRRRSAALTA